MLLVVLFLFSLSLSCWRFVNFIDLYFKEAAFYFIDFLCGFPVFNITRFLCLSLLFPFACFGLVLLFIFWLELCPGFFSCEMEDQGGIGLLHISGTEGWLTFKKILKIKKSYIVTHLVNIFFFFFSKKDFILFIHFLLCWVFVAVRGLFFSSCSEQRLLGICSFSSRWVLLLQSTGLRTCRLQ